MTKIGVELRDFSPTSIVGASAAVVSDAFVQAGEPWATMFLLVQPTAGLTNTEIAISICLIDANGVEAWLPQRILPVRTLPNGTKVVDTLVTETFHCRTFKVALETVPAGGTVSVQYAFGTV